MTRRAGKRRAGFTLVEMVLAVIILGGSLAVLYRSVIVSARMVTLAKQREEVAYVFSLGELAHPWRDIEDIEEDGPVDPDDSLEEGYTYERTVDEREDPPDDVEDDGLYVVRTIVSWGDGSEREEIVRYLRKTE